MRLLLIKTVRSIVKKQELLPCPYVPRPLEPLWRSITMIECVRFLGNPEMPASEHEVTTVKTAHGFSTCCYKTVMSPFQPNLSSRLFCSSSGNEVGKSTRRLEPGPRCTQGSGFRASARHRVYKGEAE